MVLTQRRDPAIFTAPVRREVLGVRSAVLITNISTMENQVRQFLRNERLVGTLATGFGVLALALACIGLYGILSYAVIQRTSEIGIRVALGATADEMVWLILCQAMVLAVAGTVIGVPAVLMLGRISRAFLYGVEPFDGPALSCAFLLMFVFAALAGLIPARRAGRLDPMSALKAD